jgi:hypothetical protein
MTGARTKWWLPSALAGAMGILETAVALYARSPMWVAFGVAWFCIATIYFARARP